VARIAKVRFPHTAKLRELEALLGDFDGVALQHQHATAFHAVTKNKTGKAARRACDDRGRVKRKATKPQTLPANQNGLNRFCSEPSPGNLLDRSTRAHVTRAPSPDHERITGFPFARFEHGCRIRGVSRMCPIMQPIEIRATKEKETSGTWRFEADEASAPVHYLYVRKDAFAGGDVPQKIVVTIEADHASA
jgi:hypothetical protein